MSAIPPDAVRSPVFQRNAAVHPGLARGGSPQPMVLAILGACILGGVTFFTLNGARTEVPPPVPLPAPIVQLAPAPPPSAPLVIQAAAAPPATVHQEAPPTSDTHAPAMVVDFSQAPTMQAAVPQPAVAPSMSAPPDKDDNKLSPDEQFAARMRSADVDTARASRLRDLTRMTPQGTVIPAVLETAINSDLPGFVRAVVSRDVRGFDGSRVLVPRGSKLVGQYRSGVAQSQTRAFVVWSRILTPDGVSIEIGSPGTDPLGRGGLAGETNTHFFERFGSAILLSVLDAGLNAITDGSNNTAISIGSTQQATQVASIALQKQIDIPTTIDVPQGTPLQVFLTRDLDFSGVVRP